MMQHASIVYGLVPLSSETEDGLADVLTFAQTVFGGCQMLVMDLQET